MMDKLLAILNAVDIPFTYDYFAEGESPVHLSYVIFFLEVTTTLLMLKFTTKSTMCE